MRELDSCFTVMKAKQVSPSDLDNTLHDYIEILPTDTKVCFEPIKTVNAQCVKIPSGVRHCQIGQKF